MFTRWETTRPFRQASIRMSCERLGQDLSFTLTGGAGHVGAAALACPYEARAGGSASVSVLERPGHRDGMLAATLARRICKATGRVALVQCGIHFDALLPGELVELTGLCEEMADDLTKEQAKCE